MKKYLVYGPALLAALALSAGGLACKSTPRPEPVLSAQSAHSYPELRAWLQGLVDERKMAGSVALVSRKGQIEFFETFGQRDVEAGQPMTRDTLFRIGSMSKPITSVAVMILVEEGKLALTDPVSKYVPELGALKVAVPDSTSNPSSYQLVPLQREVTILDLITHQSGMTYGFAAPAYFSQRYQEAGVSDGLSETPGTMGDNVKRLAKVPLVHQPGAGWTYGPNTDVLGHIIERISGQTLADFMEARIFRPLKMKDTGFRVKPEDEPRLAAVYQPREEQTIERLPAGRLRRYGVTYSASYPLDRDSRFFSGGAGLVSTVEDYLRFSRMMLNGGELDGVRLLKKETVEMMTRSHVTGQQAGLAGLGDSFGLGFAVVTPAWKDRTLPVGSFSWAGFYNTYFWVDPENQMVVLVMAQVFPNAHLGFPQELHKRVYPELGH